jgi:hypothetical protein
MKSPKSAYAGFGLFYSTDKTIKTFFYPEKQKICCMQQRLAPTLRLTSSSSGLVYLLPTLALSSTIQVPEAEGAVPAPESISGAGIPLSAAQSTLLVGDYIIGDSACEQLTGHPDIRY